MKIAKVSTLKKGLPQILGQEVKSVTFELLVAASVRESAQSIFLANVNSWLQEDLLIEVNLSDFSSPIKIFLSDENGGNLGFAALQRIEFGTSSALEMQLVTKFYRGLETSRIRLIEAESNLSIQVSTFMESKDPTRAIHDIPRNSDAFLQRLGNDPRASIIVDGTALKTGTNLVNAKNIAKSPLALYNKPGLLPVVGFLKSPLTSEVAEELAKDVFGLAHVLLLSDELFESQKGKSNSGDQFFVYWRDGAKETQRFDVSTETYRFKKSLFLRSLREEKFSARWRALLARVTFSSQKAVTLTSTDPETAALEARIVDLQIELEVAREQAATATKRWHELEKNLEDTFTNFGEAEKSWRKKSHEATEKAVKLHAQIKSGKVSATDFIIIAELGDDTRLETSLQNLSIVTDQAIVFTNNASRSWLQARKDGYKKPDVMESALQQLAYFALDYKLKKGQVGANIPDYALLNFGLDWIPADQALPNKTFSFEGRTWDQQKHVKADIPGGDGMNDLGRIHFDLDPKNLRVIVNHIGGKQYKNKK